MLRPRETVPGQARIANRGHASQSTDANFGCRFLRPASIGPARCEAPHSQALNCSEGKFDHDYAGLHIVDAWSVSAAVVLAIGHPLQRTDRPHRIKMTDEQSRRQTAIDAVECCEQSINVVRARNEIDGCAGRLNRWPSMRASSRNAEWSELGDSHSTRVLRAASISGSCDSRWSSTESFLLKSPPSHL